MKDALRGWLNRLVANNLLTLFLAGSLTFMLYLSVQQAEWVKDSSPISLLLAGGLIFGWLLAVSGWRGWAAALYNLLLSGLVGVQAVAAVLPPFLDFFNTPYAILVDGMHLRLVTFGLRVSGWIAALQSNHSIRDTGLFVFLLATAGWCAVAWLMWWLVRRWSALAGILPLFALMAVNVHLSRQPRSTLVAFAFLAILIIARAAYIHAQSEWEVRHVDYSTELGPEWGVGATIAAMGVVVFALLFSLLGTPEGWRLLSDMVQKSRQQMSDTANQIFAGVKPPPPDTSKNALAPPPVISLPNLSVIGRPIAQGNDIILWVKLSDPIPIPESVRNIPGQTIQVPRHYWRSEVYGVYTGRGWEPAPLDPTPAAPQAALSPAPGHYMLDQIYEINAQHGDVLFSVNEPLKTRGNVELHETLSDGSRLVSGLVSSYEVTSQAVNASANQLRDAAGTYPDGILAEYLNLPAELPARVRQMAHEVAGSESNPYQKALKIQKFLRDTYAYSLDVPEAPPGQDVVDYFLFDAPAGFCSYFSSAMTVMLRTEGVPARVAAGYAMGTFDPQKGMYRVPASASHAWVEVYFPGIGWVEFEPTPAYSEFVYPEKSSPAAAAQNQAPSDQASRGGERASQLIWLLAPLGLVLVLWFFYFSGKIERSRRGAPDLLAVRLYQRVRDGLNLAGAPNAAALTPSEYISELLPGLANYPRLSVALDQATRVYIQAAYSPRPPLLKDVIDGEWKWGRAWQELIGLFLRTRFGRRAN